MLAGQTTTDSQLKFAISETCCLRSGLRWRSASESDAKFNSGMVPDCARGRWRAPRGHMIPTFPEAVHIIGEIRNRLSFICHDPW